MSIFFWNAGILRADTPEAPLLPMNVAFRYVPQYLDESIPDDPRYARIQALLDEDGCHVILLDKTTDREAFYSTSKRRVDALAAMEAMLGRTCSVRWFFLQLALS